jgi:competence protein ComEA
VALVVAALVACAAGVVAVAQMGRGGGVTLVSGPGDTSAPAGTAATQDVLVVEVAGAVMHPGVYTLATGSRVADAIRAAGGYSADVDPRAAETKLNLAAKLSDAESIVVPRLGDSSGAVATDAAGGLVNLNTATAEQLDALPGIGPVTAAKIVASRSGNPFKSADDLVTRKIVTASTLAKFRDQVTV